MELVRINTAITKAAYERIKEECERRYGDEAQTPTVGNVIVRMSMQVLPQSTWEEEEEVREDKRAAKRKPPRAAGAARQPKAQAAGGAKE